MEREWGGRNQRANLVLVRKMRGTELECHGGTPPEETTPSFEWSAFGARRARLWAHREESENKASLSQGILATSIYVLIGSFGCTMTFPGLTQTNSSYLYLLRDL